MHFPARSMTLSFPSIRCRCLPPGSCVVSSTCRREIPRLNHPPSSPRTRCGGNEPSWLRLHSEPRIQSEGVAELVDEWDEAGGGRFALDEIVALDFVDRQPPVHRAVRAQPEEAVDSGETVTVLQGFS